jgi:hypothetical protein
MLIWPQKGAKGTKDNAVESLALALVLAENRKKSLSYPK